MIRALLLLTLFLAAGCASVDPTVRSGVDRLETLSASVDFSLVSAGGNLSGRGYLLISYPDRFRFTAVTPFGSPVADVVGEGERIVFADHREKVWFRQMRGGEGFPLAELLFRIPEGVVPLSPCSAGVTTAGFTVEETAQIDGLCLPRRLALRGGRGSMVLVFDDYEVNVPVPPESFTIGLEGFREVVLPTDERSGR